MRDNNQCCIRGYLNAYAYLNTFRFPKPCSDTKNITPFFNIYFYIEYALEETS